MKEKGKTKGEKVRASLLLTFSLLLFTSVAMAAEDTTDYLSFTAKGGDVAIGVEWTNELSSPATTNIFEWSADKENWTEFLSGASNMTVHADETVYFRRKGPAVTTLNLNPDPNSDGWRFTMTSSNKGATVAAGGNVMSLLDASCGQTEVGAYAFRFLFHSCTLLTAAPELPATELAECCYGGMFEKCVALTAAPKLPATKLAKTCYTSMFDGCTSLTVAPELPATELAYGCCTFMFANCASLAVAPKLPATELAYGCYVCMFANCASLAVAPELPATELTELCYSSMFANCASLAVAPELPATTLKEECYSDMFTDCTSLNTVAVGFEEWADDKNATFRWLLNVSENGTFICPAALPKECDYLKHIPEGWTVLDREAVCLVRIPAVEHLAASVLTNGVPCAPFAGTCYAVEKGATVTVNFAAEEGFALLGKKTVMITDIAEDITFGTTPGYSLPRVVIDKEVLVTFTVGANIESAVFRIEGDPVDMPAGGTNLYVGTLVELEVTPRADCRYTGPTDFTVPESGLDVTIVGEAKVPVKFTGGENVESVVFRIEGETVDMPAGGTNLWSGTVVELEVTPKANCRYTGPREYEVPQEGLNVMIEATEIAPGDVERPWVAGDTVMAWTNGVGELIIEGSGAMSNFVNAADVPWAAVVDEVTTVTVEEGVILGRNALAAFTDDVLVTAASTVGSLKGALGASAEPSGAVSADFETVRIVNGKALLGVLVCTNGDLTAATEGWKKVAIEKSEVVDGEAILTVPATAEKGFMILKSKAAEK